LEKVKERSTFGEKTEGKEKDKSKKDHIYSFSLLGTNMTAPPN